MSPLRCKFEGYILAYDETCGQVSQVTEDGNSITTSTLVQSTLCEGLPPTTATTGGSLNSPTRDVVKTQDTD